MDELSEEDKQAVHRARRVAKISIITIPRSRTIYRNTRVLVSIDDTIKGFNMILDGELDHLPEAAFNLVGTIEDAIAKGEKMIAEAK